MGCQYFDPCDHGADTFTIAIPKLTFGRGCLREAGARAAGLGMTRVGLFTDPGLRDSTYFETVLESLKQAGLDIAVFDEVTIEADDASVERGATFIAEGNFDGVVSIGGGSVIDTAKASMLYGLHPPDEFLDYFAPPLGAGRPMPRSLLRTWPVPPPPAPVPNAPRFRYCVSTTWPPSSCSPTRCCYRRKR
jgi:hypothetical protein